MEKSIPIVAALVLCLAGLAQAVTIDTVTVGDRQNAGELSGPGAGGYGFDRVCGSVSYNYKIGKYEVTAGQYCEFLNRKAKSDPRGLYNTTMASIDIYGGCGILRSGTSGTYSYSVAAEWAQRPVNYVNFWDACRFANWLGNGQGTGDTETGAYTLNGYKGDHGYTIQRNVGWQWAVTSEDEWYKAAYYRGGGTNAGYWDYPTQSDSAPSNQLTNPDGGNNGNFYSSLTGLTIGNPYRRTNVGEFENSESAYGTFDQVGNVWEWNETVVYKDSAYDYRGLRGGSYNLSSQRLQASYRAYNAPPLEYSDVGFRVTAVPEPSSLLILAGGVGMLLVTRRRKA